MDNYDAKNKLCERTMKGIWFESGFTSNENVAKVMDYTNLRTFTIPPRNKDMGLANVLSKWRTYVIR